MCIFIGILAASDALTWKARRLPVLGEEYIHTQNAIKVNSRPVQLASNAVAMLIQHDAHVAVQLTAIRPICQLSIGNRPSHGKKRAQPIFGRGEGDCAPHDQQRRALLIPTDRLGPGQGRRDPCYASITRTCTKVPSIIASRISASVTCTVTTVVHK